MSTLYSHPPHPSNAHKERSDPHLLPDFGSGVGQPVLYLPPLLSSLPNTFPPARKDSSKYHPLLTETRLPDIDPVSLSLHQALHNFGPIDGNYASTPYGDAFNWHDLALPIDEEREWYCVVFRSKRKAGSDGTSLYDADKLAHDEAIRNGGLILYWYGVPNPETGLNLATCIWQSRAHAMAANSRPHHIKAMRLAARAYEVYNLERYRLVKSKGSTSVHVELYTGGDVGW